MSSSKEPVSQSSDLSPKKEHGETLENLKEGVSDVVDQISTKIEDVVIAMAPTENGDHQEESGNQSETESNQGVEDKDEDGKSDTNGNVNALAHENGQNPEEEPDEEAKSTGENGVEEEAPLEEAPLEVLDIMRDLNEKTAAHIKEQIDTITTSDGEGENEAEDNQPMNSLVTNGDDADVETKSPNEEKSPFSEMSDLTMKAAAHIQEQVSAFVSDDKENDVAQDEKVEDESPAESPMEAKSVEESNTEPQDGSPSESEPRSLMAQMSDLTMQAAADIEQKMAAIVSSVNDSENGEAEGEAVEDEQEREADEAKFGGTREETEPLIEEAVEEEVSATPPGATSPAKDTVEDDFTSVIAEDGSDTNEEVDVPEKPCEEAESRGGNEDEDRPIITEEAVVLAVASSLTSAAPGLTGLAEDSGSVKDESEEFVEAQEEYPDDKSETKSETEMVSPELASEADAEESETAADADKVEHMDDAAVMVQGVGLTALAPPTEGKDEGNDDASPSKDGEAQPMDETEDEAGEEEGISSVTVMTEDAPPPDDTENVSGTKSPVPSPVAEPSDAESGDKDSQEDHSGITPNEIAENISNEAKEVCEKVAEKLEQMEDVVVQAQSALSGLATEDGSEREDPAGEESVEECDTGNVEGSAEFSSDYTQKEPSPGVQSLLEEGNEGIKIDEVVFQKCPPRQDSATSDGKISEHESDAGVGDKEEVEEDVISATTVSQAAATLPEEEGEAEPEVVSERVEEETAEQPQEKSFFAKMSDMTMKAAGHIGEKMSALTASTEEVAEKNEDGDEGKSEETESTGADREPVAELSEEAAARIEEQIEAFTTNSGVYAEPPGGEDAEKPESPQPEDGKEEGSAEKAESEEVEGAEEETVEATETVAENASLTAGEDGEPEDGKVEGSAEKAESGEVEGAEEETVEATETVAENASLTAGEDGEPEDGMNAQDEDAIGETGDDGSEGDETGKEEEIVAVTATSETAATPIEEEVIVENNVAETPSAPTPDEEKVGTPQTPMESQIESVFKLFDAEAEGKVDLKEIGSLLRCLKLNPTEAEVDEMKSELAGDNGKLSLEAFLPKALEVLLEGKFAPATEEELLDAFTVLDKNNAGFLTANQMEVYMKSKGEPLTDEEFQDMISVAADEDGNIDYKKFIQELVVAS